jgi:hypothetical protein
MIVFPENLSYDWQMGSIPLITSVRDHRNLLTLTIMAFISIICLKCRSLIFDMTKSIIILLNGKQEPKFLSKSCPFQEKEADQVCRSRLNACSMPMFVTGRVKKCSHQTLAGCVREDSLFHSMPSPRICHTRDCYTRDMRS